MSLIEDLRERVRFIRRQPPGRRFRAYYEKFFHFRDPLQYLLYLALGILFFFLAIAFAILPGPAILFWILCAICIRIPFLGKILDHLELWSRNTCKRFKFCRERLNID